MNRNTVLKSGGPKKQLRLVKQQYRVGTQEAGMCFLPQKWNLKADMRCQLSPFPSSNAAIAMQHHPGNVHQSVATPRATLWMFKFNYWHDIETMAE